MKLFRGDKEKHAQDFENYDEQDYDWDDDEEMTEEDYDFEEDSESEDGYYKSEDYVADEPEYYEPEDYMDENAEYYGAEDYTDENAEYYGQEEYTDEESEYYESEEYGDDIDTYEKAGESGKDAAGYYEVDAYDVQNAGYAAQGYTEEYTEYYAEDAYGESGAEEQCAETYYTRQDDGLPEKETLFARVRSAFQGMDTMDRVMVATGLIVLVLAIVTGGVFLSSHIVERQVEDFADVGKQLDGITLIGEQGLLAVADAEQARLAAASVVAAEEEKPPKEYDETGYDKQVTVALNFTSIQKDLKIKFINTKTDKLVPNVPFSVTVTDPNGKTYIWSDDDMDGIIYKKDITPGDYQIAMEALTDSKYSDYIVSTNTQSAEVKKEIAYKKVDVSNEVKQESEVNAAKEDTKKNETAVESSLQDTVTWVESKVIAASYNEVSKSTIPDPATIAAGRFLRMQESKITFVSQDVTPDPNPVDPSTSTEEPATPELTTKPTPELTTEPTPEPTTEPTPEPTEGPTPEPTATPTAEPAPTPTAEPTPAPTPTPEPSATPSPSPSPSPTVSPTPLPIGISLDKLTMDVLTNTPATVNATITGAVNTDPAVTAESSDTNVAYVSVDRRTVTVTGVAEGSAVITVKYTENNQTVTATCTVTVKKHPKEDNVTLLKDANGQQIYVQENNTYREATRADYYTASNFFVKGSAKYTGWQTIDGHVYFFTADGNKVTGEQVIQGAKYNFASDGALVVGSGAVGIDVSKWNGTIDWNAVKNSGISYVIIRCGYRGSSAGTLIEDPKFQANIKGATAAGLKVGVYFFTQAVDEIEAVEEASMVLDLVKNYKISYPIFLDVEASGGRADKIDKATRTAVCKAFCQTIQNANYTAGIYANKTWLTSKIDASSLSAYKIWLAQYAASPSYTGRYDLWQYRSTGSVSGISGNVDMNISYLGY